MNLFPGAVRLGRVSVQLIVDNTEGDGEIYLGFEGTNHGDTPKRKLIYPTDYFTTEAINEPVKVNHAVKVDDSVKVDEWLKIEGLLDEKEMEWDAQLTRYEVKDEKNHVWLDIYVDLGDSCPPPKIKNSP